ncbi:hypothetical protein PEC302107_35900 [Pectobacterium araliae]|uniref:hypothetical protein n=1 Tax=Pectobacterium araliae TaxID=3073862 RepID=UPI002086347E|nr:hypothetical protein PEC302107_35900 [Pectobacterium carotovorum subsp. carotovorum]
MTIELWLVPLIFAYAMASGYVFSTMASKAVTVTDGITILIKSIMWLPVIVLMISTYVAAKVLGDEGNPEG